MSSVTDNEPIGRLTLRQRRQMGLTIANVLSTGRELARRGEITRGMDKREAAELVAQEVALTNAKAWADNAASVDWDAILAFIERLIELIMTLFVR